MLLTITTTHHPATDLGFLLHKHPDRAQQLTVSHGVAHVFYPEATRDRCTVALLVEVDPVALVRGRSQRHSGPLAQYINDRPYAAGSQLAVALRAAFATALRGRCESHPQLAQTSIPLSIHVPSLSVRSGRESRSGQDGVDLISRLFSPLGWTVTAATQPFDATVPHWGAAPYVDTRLEGTFRLADALSHLYVLLPVLDGGHHFWVTETEVSKLLRSGETWLSTHPERDLITSVYLARSRPLVESANEQLDMFHRIADGPAAIEADAPAEVTASPQHNIPLAELRRRAVLEQLRRADAQRILDLGCGPGALLDDLRHDTQFREIIGTDVSAYALRQAERKLHLDRDDAARSTVRLRQSSLMYTDPALRGFDAAVLMEVIEHINPDRLPAATHSVFGAARPRTVIVTTPNAEYNSLFPGLSAGEFRHADHRFEWSRTEFQHWAEATAATYDYSTELLPVGPLHPDRGAPTQMAIFTARSGT
ncbi:3' terminal RNA ribose 2'-O-methyltransferase Hen1 [Hoyosella altamirensis]|uniref:Small RNA 2'-O-methyltransferase n=1 Tax=Hoyosella altamirensis TaxID=616997 RepID=A0A839RKX6_9ACTN|nr:3' terminal RNA ribose 2'-O-methyltransferase Hen1 [Hoyosella altamirensis]MBB3036641.1 3' terminal RNA ribose 2'-O-methyltransferase Hen1 [Hoyosella altamirensis]